MNGIRKCIEPLSDILNELGANFEDDFANGYDDDLLRDMGIDMGSSPDEFGYDENDGTEW
jgi:hypothetical protein